jgi:glycosyltransferase involved in cell wall biosynthesis
LRVLLVARLIPVKGINDFLSVATSLWKESFEFVIVGPSSAGYKELLSKVQDHHRRQIIDYKGELSPSATFDQFSKAHVLYFPSFGEGMARVMLECGYSRTCPIAYDIPSNRDLVDTGRGFLVHMGATHEVLNLLKNLNNNRKLLENNAVAYQNYVLRHFNINAYSHRMDQIIQNLTLEVKTS